MSILCYTHKIDITFPDSVRNNRHLYCFIVWVSCIVLRKKAFAKPELALFRMCKFSLNENIAKPLGLNCTLPILTPHSLEKRKIEFVEHVQIRGYALKQIWILHL
jgi:hypothetical protein